MSQNNCLQVQNKYKNDMGSVSYYWAELLSTVKHDRFYLHGRCWLYQMEYQNIWLFCIFYSDQHTCRHGRGKKEKKKKFHTWMTCQRQTGKREQLHRCTYTCINPRDFNPRCCT